MMVVVAVGVTVVVVMAVVVVTEVVGDHEEDEGVVVDMEEVEMARKTDDVTEEMHLIKYSKWTQFDKLRKTASEYLHDLHTVYSIRGCSVK